MTAKSVSTPLLVVAGPTGSGKSAISHALARALNGEILSIDSVQVFRGLDIGSAKATQAERASVPHHLIDIRDPDAEFNAAEFIAEAERAILDIHRRGKVCVVCGGTTLYLTLLLHGLVEAPPKDLEIRRKLEKLSEAELYLKLQALDPESAERIHPNDRIRLTRALEAAEISGGKLSELHRSHAYSKLLHPALILVPCWERSELYKRIDMRTAAMVRAGLLDETESVLRRYPRSSHALRTLGYAQAQEVLGGTLAVESLEDKVAMQTRRYAKRQMTYWRNEPKKRGWQVRPRAGERSRLLKVEDTVTSRPTKSFEVLPLGFSDLLLEIKKFLGKPLDAVDVWYIDAAPICEEIG